MMVDTLFCTQEGEWLQTLQGLSAGDGEVCDSGCTEGPQQSEGDGHIPHQGRSTTPSHVWLNAIWSH